MGKTPNRVPTTPTVNSSPGKASSPMDSSTKENPSDATAATVTMGSTAATATSDSRGMSVPAPQSRPPEPSPSPSPSSDQQTVRTEDVRPNAGGGGAPGRNLSVFAALFGECLCADAFRLRPSDLRSESSRPRSLFVSLDGVECVGLGAVVVDSSGGGHSPRERVRETTAQLGTDPQRLVGVGYLVEGGACGEEARKGANRMGFAAESDGGGKSGEPGGRQAAAAAVSGAGGDAELAQSPSQGMRTELVPLGVYEETYPDDLERSLSKHARDALGSLQRGEFPAALQSFEVMAKEQRNQIKKSMSGGGSSSSCGNDSRYLIGITLHNMAVIHLLAGGDDDDDAALSLFEEAAELKRAAFGDDHPEVASTLVEIGIQYFARDMPDEAMEALNEARRIRVRSLGSDHPKVAMVVNNIGCVYFQRKSPVAALTSFQEARDMQQHAMETGQGAKVELDLLHVATTLCNLAYMKFRLKSYDEARAIFDDALLVQQSVLGDSHQTVKDTLSNIAIANAFHS